MKNISNFSFYQIISRTLFSLFFLSLIGCGEGKPGTPPVKPGSAAIPYEEVLLNDTGVTLFIDSENNYDPNIINDTPLPINKFIEPPNYPGQDAKKGRDVTHNDDFGGVKGFDFVKLDKDTGNELANNAIEFGCVKDKVTGLIWENKTKPNNSSLNDYYKLHDGSAIHTWFNNNNNTNGGNEGQQASNSTCPSEIIAGDTMSFVEAVNTEQLCGFKDWRIPTTEELRSLVNYSVANGNFVDAMVDTNFFPYIAYTLHRWTSQTNAFDAKRAYGFHLHDGLVQAHEKHCNSVNASNYGNGAIVVRGVY